VPGLDLDDVRVGERRVFVAEGKGGRQRPFRRAVFARAGRPVRAEPDLIGTCANGCLITVLSARPGRRPLQEGHQHHDR
jgi:hypothetical protein